MWGSYSSEYNRLVSLMDRILQYTDVRFGGKDVMLTTHLGSVGEIELMKVAFDSTALILGAAKICV